MRFPLRLVATIYLVYVVCAVGMVWLTFWDNRYLDDPSKALEEEHRAESKQSEFQKFAHDVVGPGANGSSLVFEMSSFSEAEQEKMRQSYKDHGFNGYLSDIVPLDRKLKDPRLQICKNIRYPANLPQVSVVIPFRNEVLSMLLRTVYSILGNTPDHLLKEIILVDDGSTLDNLKTFLDIHIQSLEKVSVIRMNTSVGLMMARQAGIDTTTADYFVCMDSHMEATEGWLEPLIARLLENPKALLCSSIGVISKDHFGVWFGTPTSSTDTPFFHWSLEQDRVFYRPETKAAMKNTIDPIPYPTVQGMMIVMKKSWFLQLGGFDPGMKLWGTEQMELSIKVWTCGGVVEMIPCSNVAHLYRERVIWTFRDEGIINKIRFAEVWMDEYKEIFQRYNKVEGIDFGNLEDRKRIRRENNCKPFQYYLDQMQKIVYLYIPKNLLYNGTLYNQHFDMCLEIRASSLGIGKCHTWYTEMFEISSDHELHNFNHVFVKDEEGNLVRQKWTETDENTQTKWDYRNQTMVHQPSGKCLCGHSDGRVTLEICNHEKNQKWLWRESH